MKLLTHADDSPVCRHCRQKGAEWFKLFPKCVETGKEPIFIEKEVMVKPRNKGPRIQIDSAGATSLNR